MLMPHTGHVHFLAIGTMLASSAPVAADSFLPSSYTIQLPQPVPRRTNWSIGVIEPAGSRTIDQSFRALQVWVTPSNESQFQISQSSGGVASLGNLSIASPPYYFGEGDGNSTRGFLPETLNPNVVACMPDRRDGSANYSWTFNTAQYPDAAEFRINIAEMFWINAQEGVREVDEDGRKLLCISPPIRNFSIQTVTYISTTEPSELQTGQGYEPPSTTEVLPVSTHINAYGELQHSDNPGIAARSIASLQPRVILLAAALVVMLTSIIIL